MMHLSNLIPVSITLLLITFFAGIQIAFVSANRLNIEVRKKKGRKSSAIISQYMDEPSGLLGACLTGLTICMVVYGLLVSDVLKVFNINNEYLKLFLDIIIAFGIAIVFAEFLPNTIFRRKSDSLLMFFASTSKFFYNIFYPVSTFFVNIAESLLKYLFNTRVKERSE